MNKILCFFGFHDWEYKNENRLGWRTMDGQVYDIEAPERTCKRCRNHQIRRYIFIRAQGYLLDGWI